MDWNFDQQCGSNQPFEVLITNPLTGDPVDLTGATAEWIFASESGGLISSTNLIYLSTANGKINSLGVDGKVSGSLLPSDTLSVATSKDVRALHQMFVTLPDGQPTLVQKGYVTFKPKLPTPSP